MGNAVPKAVPSAVNPSTAGNQIPVLNRPQLGPHQPMTGSARVPAVPRTETEGELSPQPGNLGYGATTGSGPVMGLGAPSVPGMNGILFTPGPIDAHYTDMAQAHDPYAKVNNPPTRGMFTRIQMFLNHIATSQDTDNTGRKMRHPQQRTSVMRNQLPNHGSGYAPQTFIPHQLPQAVPVYKYPPATGTSRYGTGVLNSDTFGAGQTAGGQGGSNYAAPIGQPVTTQVNPGVTGGMPSWG